MLSGNLPDCILALEYIPMIVLADTTELNKQKQVTKPVSLKVYVQVHSLSVGQSVQYIQESETPVEFSLVKCKGESDIMCGQSF